MDGKDVVPFELVRLFLGEQPGLFYLEILFRTLLIYSWTLLLVRWIGGRSVSQLSLVDFVLVIALGSAVGDAMFYADVPLLQAMAVVAVVILATKGLQWLTLRLPVFNQVIDDCPVWVVREGRIEMAGLRDRNLSCETLKEMLRIKDVTNLGEVRAAWIEGSGALSLLRADDPRPGLAIMPPAEIEPHPPATGPDAICTSCAAPAPRSGPDSGPESGSAPCPECGCTGRTDPRRGARI